MKVLLGVCGGIAAYKAAELTRELARRGAEVQVVMTAGAERFVTPLTFATLSGRQVLGSMWEPSVRESGSAGEFEIEHIRVAQEIDVLVIAPATANTIAKLAQGLADDLLSTIFLATRAAVVVAPAMNVNMWRNAATQRNVELLRSRGMQFVEPGDGYLACGMVGEGRLAEVTEIAHAAMATERGRGLQDLAGETILITAGGTREPIDPVRYIGNRSSGKMGFALAEAALARGAEVILISATEATHDAACEVIRVETASEMQQAVLAKLPRVSAVLMAAAVGDFSVGQPAAQKLKKRGEMTLELVENDDILRRVVRLRKPETLVVGFAAETENVVAEGRRKLREKGVDAMVANDVSQRDRGFGSDKNAGVFLTRTEEVELPLETKREMAEKILSGLMMLRTAAVVEKFQV